MHFTCVKRAPRTMTISRFVPVAAIVLTAMTRVASAGLITFDELSVGTVIDGQTIDIVTFDFSVGGASSSDAAISLAGPGDTPLFTPPNLEGDRSGE